MLHYRLNAVVTGTLLQLMEVESPCCPSLSFEPTVTVRIEAPERMRSWVGLDAVNSEVPGTNVEAATTRRSGSSRPRPGSRGVATTSPRCSIVWLSSPALNKAGFTISEVGQLLAGEDEDSARWRALAEQKLREVDTIIEKAQATRRVLEESLRCNCVVLEECASVLGEASR